MSDEPIRRSDPSDLARGGQARQLPKRFYTNVTVEARGGGYAVHLDGRPLRTPNKLVLVLPTSGMAAAIAEEWDAQREHIDPMSMPLTRLVNSVRDQVDGREPQVRADIVKYAGSDLLCYRADGPSELIAAQAAAWDPVLDWARESIGVDLAVCTGIMHVSQSDSSRVAVEAAVTPLESFQLASAHVMTTLLGSVVLMLAVRAGRLTPEEAWKAAHVDENWQISKWGADAEATRRQENRKIEFLAAVRLSRLVDEPA
jgi:chaperone required for assembly of F1-ATPase